MNRCGRRSRRCGPSGRATRRGGRDRGRHRRPGAAARSPAATGARGRVAVATASVAVALAVLPDPGTGGRERDRRFDPAGGGRRGGRPAGAGRSRPLPVRRVAPALLLSGSRDPAHRRRRQLRAARGDLGRRKLRGPLDPVPGPRAIGRSRGRGGNPVLRALRRTLRTPRPATRSRSSPPSRRPCATCSSPIQEQDQLGARAPTEAETHYDMIRKVVYLLGHATEPTLRAALFELLALTPGVEPAPTPKTRAGAPARPSRSRLALTEAAGRSLSSSTPRPASCCPGRRSAPAAERPTRATRSSTSARSPRPATGPDRWAAERAGSRWPLSHSAWRRPARVRPTRRLPDPETWRCCRTDEASQMAAQHSRAERRVHLRRGLDHADRPLARAARPARERIARRAVRSRPLVGLTRAGAARPHRRGL